MSADAQIQRHVNFHSILPKFVRSEHSFRFLLIWIQKTAVPRSAFYFVPPEVDQSLKPDHFSGFRQVLWHAARVHATTGMTRRNRSPFACFGWYLNCLHLHFPCFGHIHGDFHGFCVGDAAVDLLLVHEVFICLHVFPQTAGVGVSLGTARDFAFVGFFDLVRSGVLETVAGIGVGFIATWNWTDVRFFPAMRARVDF